MRSRNKTNMVGRLAVTLLIAVSVFMLASPVESQAGPSSKDSIQPDLGYLSDLGSGLVGTGYSGASTNRNLILGFTLPTLPFGTTTTVGLLKFEITKVRDTGDLDPQLDVYLLSTNNPDSSGTNLFYQGDADPSGDVAYVGSTYIESDATELVFADDEEDRVFPIRGDALALLQSFYGGDHIPDQPEAFFRFNLDVDPGTAYDRYTIDVGSAESELLLTGVSCDVNSKDSIIGRKQVNYANSVGYYPDENYSLIGVTGSGASLTRRDYNLVLGYSLPVLPAGTTVSNVFVEFEITAARDHDNQDPSLNVYLLDTASPDGSGTNFYFHGASDPATDVELVGSNYIAVSTTNTPFADDLYDHTFEVSGDALTLIKSFYGGNNIPSQSEAFFRFNMNKMPPSLATSTPYQQYSLDLGAGEAYLYIVPTESTILQGSVFTFQ